MKIARRVDLVKTGLCLDFTIYVFQCNIYLAIYIAPYIYVEYIHTI